MSYAPIQHEAAYEAAIRRNIIANARKTFYKNTPDADTLVEYMVSGMEKGNKFLTSFYEGFQTYGKMSEKQCQVLRDSMARDAERKAKFAAEKAATDANLAFLGEPKQKITVTLTVKKTLIIHRAPLFYGDNGISIMKICADESGNVVMYKGTAQGFPEEGETRVITATVKSHEVYNGTRQTWIQRPKVAA